MSPGGGDLQGAFDMFLALNVAEIGLDIQGQVFDDYGWLRHETFKTGQVGVKGSQRRNWDDF
jgi:hypothetical protein